MSLPCSDSVSLLRWFSVLIPPPFLFSLFFFLSFSPLFSPLGPLEILLAARDTSHFLLLLLKRHLAEEVARLYAVAGVEVGDRLKTGTH